MSFSYFDAAVGAAIPTLVLSYPYGLQLAALVPIGFAAGLFAVLQAARASQRQRSRRKTPLAGVPARSAA
jgi:hypothetical protein